LCSEGAILTWQPRVIQMVHGIGYVFVPGSSADKVLV
jgi:hypothetical protein